MSYGLNGMTVLSGETFMFNLKTKILIIVALSTQLHLSIAAAQQDRVEADKMRIKQMLEGFYKSYISDNNLPESKRPKDPKAPVLKHSQLFTKEFLLAYRKFMSRSDIDHDPIVQSNDVPEKFIVKEVRLDGSTAYARLEYVGYPADTPLLEVRLKEQNGTWLIDAIGDFNKAQPRRSSRKY